MNHDNKIQVFLFLVCKTSNRKIVTSTGSSPIERTPTAHKI